MRKGFSGVTGVSLLLGGLLVCGAANDALARVDVGINVNLGPPPIVVPAPPEVVLVPGSQVYFVPGIEFDVFFHNGYWWSPRGDRWYRSRAYDGPWRIVERRYVPAPVYRVPREYRNVYRHERHIPYGEWKRDRGRYDRGEHRGDGEHRDRDEYRERGEHGRGHER